MKHVTKFNDLSAYGIEPLTGEACGIGFRILCDVTAKGKKLIAKALGVPDVTLAEPWNCGSKLEPHVGSIMLAPSAMPLFGVFALLDDGCSQVWLYKGGGLCGIEDSDDPETVAACRRLGRDDIVQVFYYKGTAPGRDRNVHAMSGRTA